MNIKINLSPDIIRLYKKSNCKVCNNKGYMLYADGSSDYCRCVLKNLEKAKKK